MTIGGIPMAVHTIYLVDGFEDGHHLTHLRNYASQLLAMGHRVVELLPDPATVAPWFEAACPDARERLRLRSYRHPEATSPSWRLRNVIKPLRLWRTAARAVRNAEHETGWKADLVFFNWLDDYIVGWSPLVPALLPAVFPRPWSGVFFHPWHLRIPEGPTRHESMASESMLRSRRCAGVAVLDRWIADALAASIQKPVIVFPDETDTALPGREPDIVARLRAAAAGRRLVLLPGVLARRKGVVSLLDAAHVARGRPWLFAFVGAFDDGLRGTYSGDELARIDAAIAGALPNVWFHPERLADERDFNAVVNAVDVLYAAYELFAHSSGIVTKAGFFRKPILVSPGFCMAREVNAYGLGSVVDPRDTAAVVRALDIVLDADTWKQQIGDPDYERFQRDYAAEALQPAFAKLLGSL